jgi:hypothetical protein
MSADGPKAGMQKDSDGDDGIPRSGSGIVFSIPTTAQEHQ